MSRAPLDMTDSDPFNSSLIDFIGGPLDGQRIRIPHSVGCWRAGCNPPPDVRAIDKASAERPRAELSFKVVTYLVDHKTRRAKPAQSEEEK